MEPRAALSSAPEMGAYHTPESSKQAERKGDTQSIPEQLPSSPESGERATGASAQPAPIVPLPQMPNLPAPQATPVSPRASSNNANPLTASNEDLIEKEWVDKAKKIVAQTKDDPYTQEKEVSRLQADYLKKRYGKEIKLTSD